MARYFGRANGTLSGHDRASGAPHDRPTVETPTRRIVETSAVLQEVGRPAPSKRPSSRLDLEGAALAASDEAFGPDIYLPEGGELREPAAFGTGRAENSQGLNSLVT